MAAERVTPLRVLPNPEAVGEHVATQLLDRIGRARADGRRFLLGAPTGRTPRPIFAAMARRLAESRQDISHVTLVMMDEYLVGQGGALAPASSDAPWSYWSVTSWWYRPPRTTHLPSIGFHVGDPSDPSAYCVKSSKNSVLSPGMNVDFSAVISG